MKKIFRMALVCALAGATLLYTGCTKDYSDDINDLKDRVSSVESTVASLQAAINAGSVITNVQANSEGYLVTLSNGQSYQVYNGKQGEKGDKGDKGDTGATGATGAQGAQGEKGDKGDKGDTGAQGEKGDKGDKGDTGAQGEKGDKGDKGDTGAAGTVVTIGEDGYFYFDGKKTDYIARGEKGETGATGATGAKGDKGDTPKMTVGENGNWFADGVDTGVKAQGEKGDKGDAGYTPYIGENGNWWIKDATTGEPTDTGVKATTNQITLDEDGYICIDGKSTGVKAGNVAVWDEEAGTVTFLNIDGEGGELVIGVCELTSIVFVPQLYLEGIEAMEYDYVKGYYKAATVNSKKAATGPTVEGDTDDGGNTYYFPKNTVVKFGDLKTKVNNKEVKVDYDFNEIATAEYHVNPTSFDLSKATFTLEPSEKYYATRADEFDWDVNLVDIVRDGNVAKVTYTIEHPEYATPTEYTYFGKTYTAEPFDGDFPISLLRLNAQLNDSKKEVSSDYAAIAPFAEAFADLAFISKYSTKEDKCKHMTESALYATAEEAVKAESSVTVQYQNIDTDLSKIIKVHMNPAGSKIHQASAEEESYTLAEIQAKYPGLDYKFEIINYSLGDHDTSEGAYGDIEGYDFHPGYPDLDGNFVHNTGDAKSGKSSIGRKPLVLCTLIDTNKNNYVVLAGFFKILITEDEAYRDAFVVKDFTMPYLCESEQYSTWLDCSFTALENELNMSKQEFKDRYGSKWSGNEKDNNEAWYVAPFDTYVLNAKGEYVNTVTYYEPSDNTYTPKFGCVSDVLGKFVYVADPKSTTASTNDKFGIVLTQDQMDIINYNYGGEVTLYGKFGQGYDYIFIGINIKIADKPVVKFVEHNPAYWYQTSDSEGRNIIFVNPRVPETKTTDVKIYNKWLNSVWAYNSVEIKLDDASKAVYNKVWSTTGYTYHYELAPAKEQPKILGKNVYVAEDEDNDYLYWNVTKGKETDPENLLITLNTKDVEEYDPEEGTVDLELEDKGQSKMSIEERTYGKITYNNASETAKYVLNQFSAPTFTDTENITDQDLADMLYVNVNLVATYDDCEIDLGTEQFHVAFFRPIDVLSGTTKTLTDAVDGGDMIKLGDFFNAVDWQGHEIFGVKKTQTSEKGVTPVTYKEEYVLNESKTGVTWWDYYAFETITFRIDKMMTDMVHSDLDYVYDYTDNETNPSKPVSYTGVQKALKVKLVWVDPEGEEDDVEKYDVAKTFPYGDAVTFGAGAQGWNGEVFGDKVDAAYMANNCYFVLHNNESVFQKCNLYIPVEIQYSWGTVSGTVVIPVAHTTQTSD